MITLKTPTMQVVKEICSEEDKAIYWLKKMFHGQKGYEQMQARLVYDSEREKKDKRSEIYDYISPNGNRWMVFEHCKYYESIKHSCSMAVAFCYYETMGSCGAFLVAHSQFGDNEQGVIMFTDHFFLRFCDRLGVEMRSRWMIQRFVEVIPGFLFSFGEKNEQGFIKAFCRLPGSMGRGILRKDGPLIEIRSYLTDKQQNKKQQRETEWLRTVADRQSYEPMEVRQARLLLSDDFSGEFQKEIVNVAELSGVDRGELIAATNISIYVVQALIDLKYAEPYDIEFWKRCGKCMNAEKFLDIVQGMEKNPSDSMTYTKMLYDIIENIGSYMSIKKYDAKAVMEKTIEYWKKHYDESR